MLDLDGTMIKTGEPLDGELAKYLKNFQEKSNVLITTGRHPLGVKFAIGSALGFVPTISLNGGGLHLTSWSKFDEVIYFPKEIITQFRTGVTNYDLTITYYGRDFWAVSDISQYIKKESAVTGMKPINWNEQFAGSCIKIMIMARPAIIKRVRGEINKKFSNRLNLSASRHTYLEISPANVDKVTFMDIYLKHLSNTSDNKIHTIFVGDSENDLSCAKFADESWTFPSAPEELKDVSTGILADNNGA